MFFGISAMIIVGISWIIWGYVASESPKHKLDIGVLVVNSSACAFIVCTVLAITAGFPKTPWWQTLLVLGLVFIGSMCNFMQLHLMSKAMLNGPKGIIWSIIQAGFIFPFLMGLLFFNVAPGFFNIGGIICILLSLAIFGLCNDNNSRGKWKLLVFLAFISTGASHTLSNLPSYFQNIGEISGMWRAAATSAGLIGGFVLVSIFDRKLWLGIPASFRNPYNWIYIAAINSFEVIANSVFLYPGMDALAQHGHGAIASPLMVGTSIIAFELYAIVLLREKRSIMQITAMLICLLGIVSICF